MTKRNPSTLRAIERDVYKADRLLGEASALQRDPRAELAHGDH